MAWCLYAVLLFCSCVSNLWPVTFKPKQRLIYNELHGCILLKLLLKKLFLSLSLITVKMIARHVSNTTVIKHSYLQGGVLSIDQVPILSCHVISNAQHSSNQNIYSTCLPPILFLLIVNVLCRWILSVSLVYCTEPRGAWLFTGGGLHLGLDGVTEVTRPLFVHAQTYCYSWMLRRSKPTSTSHGQRQQTGQVPYASAGILTLVLF